MVVVSQAYKLPAKMPVTEADLIKYCQEKLEASKFLKLLQILARGKDAGVDDTSRHLRLNTILPVMIHELLMRGVSERRAFEMPLYFGEQSSVNGLSVQAHALLARVFAMASQPMIDAAMKEGADARRKGALSGIKRGELPYAVIDNVGFRMAHGKWQQLTLLIISAYTEGELEAVGYLNATDRHDHSDLTDVSIGITEATIDALKSAFYSYIDTAIVVAEIGPRTLDSEPVMVTIPICLVNTGYRDKIHKHYRELEESLKNDPQTADQLPITTGLGALLRGFKYARIFKLDLAKTTALTEMVSHARSHVNGMYSNLPKEDRNVVGVGRMGLPFGLDGNPMFTGAVSKPPIISLSFPATESVDVAEEKSEGRVSEKKVEVHVSGVPGKFHFGLVAKGSRGKLGSLFSDVLFSTHRKSQNALNWVNKPGDPRSWYIEFLQDVLSQLAVASLECAGYSNLTRRPEPDEVYTYMIARASQCPTAEYHLFLLTIDVCLLQLAQCELSGESRHWEHFASVLELVFATSNNFKYMRLRVLECIRYALASDREKILLDTLLFARSTAGGAMWSLDLLMEKFVYQFRDLMGSRDWLAGSWTKAQDIVNAFPEHLQLRRASGNRVLKVDKHGRAIQGSDSLTRPSLVVHLDPKVFVPHFDLYARSKLWVHGSNLFMFPKGPYKSSSSPIGGTPFDTCVTLDGRAFGKNLVRRLVVEGEKRCIQFAESHGVSCSTRAVSRNSGLFPPATLGAKVPPNFFKLFNLTESAEIETAYFEHVKKYSFVPSSLMVNLPGTRRAVITLSVARTEILRRLKKRRNVGQGGLETYGLFESARAQSVADASTYTKQTLSEMVKMDVISLLCSLRQSHSECLTPDRRSELYPPYVAPDVATTNNSQIYLMPRIIHHRRDPYPSPPIREAEFEEVLWETTYRYRVEAPIEAPSEAPSEASNEAPSQSYDSDEGDTVIKLGNAEEEDEELNLMAESGEMDSEEDEEEPEEEEEDGT